MNTLIIFSILTIINVILSTIKSIVTIKSGKTVASLISAGYYGFYNVVLIYTVADFPLWQKVTITFLCNLIGVFIVKWLEERMRKDKLWKVELTIRSVKTLILARQLDELSIPYNYITNVGKYSVFNIYCATQKESAFVRELAEKHNAKFFASESKQL